MKAYIDTNVYDYVALRHPLYGEPSKKILTDIYEDQLEAYGSVLVAIEILGSLAEVDSRIASGAVEAYLSLPIKTIHIDERILKMAGDIVAEAGVSYDSIHASAMCSAGVSTVITEDLEHWSKIKQSWSRIRERTGAYSQEIEFVRPMEYDAWKSSATK